MKCIACYRTNEGKGSVHIWPSGLCGHCTIADPREPKQGKVACRNCGSTDWHEMGTRNDVDSCSECGYRPAPKLLRDMMERDIYKAYGSGPTADKTIQGHRLRKAKIEASLGPPIKQQPPTV